ncbi:hypothetical protein H8E52_03615 [bacterium]|nr:hypothetical protein [bacterium]
MKKNLSITFIALLLAVPVLAMEFSHELHVVENEMGCVACHPAITRGAAMPNLTVCLDCHDDEIGASFGETPRSHFGDYRFEHQFHARMSSGECVLCHNESEDCTFCHHGENVDFLSHDRNHRYNHSLDAMKGTESCYSCHGSQDYCNVCHLAEGIKPASHFEAGFGGAGGHTDAARADVQSCIMCHDGPEPPPNCAICHQ